MAYSAE